MGSNCPTLRVWANPDATGEDEATGVALVEFAICRDMMTLRTDQSVRRERSTVLSGVAQMNDRPANEVNKPDNTFDNSGQYDQDPGYKVVYQPHPIPMDWLSDAAAVWALQRFDSLSISDSGLEACQVEID